MPRRLAVVLVAGAGIAGAHLLDGWAYQHLAWPAAGDRDWGRLLRVLGFAPTWLVLALLLWLEGRSRPQGSGRPLISSARAVVAAVVVGGIMSEVAKLLIGRERPNVAGGLYQFRTFDLDSLNTASFGMPSGHTMVAFSGAGALSRRYPRLAPVLLALAAGCGLTRVFAQAHFLSDVVAGAVAGGWISGPITRWVAEREVRTDLPKGGTP